MTNGFKRAPLQPRGIAPRLAALSTAAALLWPGALRGEPVAVRQAEGVVHGFLALRALDGSPLADGDLIQVARGDRVTSQLVFHFKDGSIHEETAVFSQRQHFRLLSDHLVQKGPAFPQPVDMSIDCLSGGVTVRYLDEHGSQKVDAERLTLPADLANGLVLIMLKNMRAGSPLPTVSMLAATPKPRLVKLAFAIAGEDSFAIGGSTRKAIHYIVKIQIGGLAGALAPLLGKQPPDSHMWILDSEAPAFVKSEGPLYLGGPRWRIELISPVWPPPPAGK